MIKRRSCRRTPLLIDFAYDRKTNTYSNEKFISDAHLVAYIRQGTTEQPLYRNDRGWIKLDEILGTIVPENFYQNEVTGENNIESARGALLDLYFSLLAETEEFED